jgi:hypothetical protein
MEKSETIGKLAEALAKAQGEIKPAAFDATNPHFKSKYATLGAIVESCKDALSKNGIAVIQGTNSADGRVIVETMLMHVSGEWIKSSLSMKTERDNAQGCGAVITYGRRYSLAAMVGIVADEDTDGEVQNKGQGGVKNDAKAYKPIPVKQNTTAPVKTQHTTIADKTIGKHKPADEFTPEDATVIIDPVPEVKAAARPIYEEAGQPGSRESVVAAEINAGRVTGLNIDQSSKNAGQIADEIKKIRVMAQAYGCKSTEDFCQLMNIAVGRDVTTAVSLNDDERTRAIEFLTQAAQEANNG